MMVLGGYESFDICVIISFKRFPLILKLLHAKKKDKMTYVAFGSALKPTLQKVLSLHFRFLLLSKRIGTQGSFFPLIVPCLVE